MKGWLNSETVRDRLVGCLIVAVAAALAIAGIRPYAGSWNDGSRLATVESLVDQNTWIIDHSTFVQVPADVPSPYDPCEPRLRKHGTLDKLLIDGHYYSDKSPVPALLLAGVYQIEQWLTGWTAREHPENFCRTMTLASSVLAYVLAVVCIYRLGRVLRLPLFLNAVLTGSFAFATVALRYAEQVNNHILLLGVTAVLVLQVAQVVVEAREGRVQPWRFLILGALAGLCYTIDLGTGPVIFLATALFVFSCRRVEGGGWRVKGEEPPTTLHPPPSTFIWFVLSAAPWLALHHALNYWIGGTFKPANANPAYFAWPSSPFRVGNLTGSWVHDGPFSFLLYAASMLAGKRGFLGHNLPLFLVIPGFILLWRRASADRRGLLWAGGCCVGAWLLYAATSNNSSGQCCTIRWFVPLLAPAYYVLALLLRRYPRYAVDFLVLSGWGLLLVALMPEGPWMKHMVPLFWPIQAAALASWAVCRVVGGEWRVEGKNQGTLLPPPFTLHPPPDCRRSRSHLPSL